MEQDSERSYYFPTLAAQRDPVVAHTQSIEFLLLLFSANVVSRSQRSIPTIAIQREHGLLHLAFGYIQAALLRSVKHLVEGDTCEFSI